MNGQVFAREYDLDLGLIAIAETDDNLYKPRALVCTPFGLEGIGKKERLKDCLSYK